MGADMAYVSADGRYLFAGDLYEIDTRANLTEQGRAAARSKLLAKLDERDMIVFAPQVVKHTITVFTDVECGYCRKLHGQIDQLNQARRARALRWRIRAPARAPRTGARWKRCGARRIARRRSRRRSRARS